VKHKISFSHNYPKLWGQNTARLIYVCVINRKSLPPELIEYDTKTEKGTHYELPNGKLIQLVFLGNKGIPFCTLRRFTETKLEYYKDLLGEVFEVKIKKGGV